MSYLSGLYAENKTIVLYVLMLALLRGIFVPDFRYGLVSAVIIQVIFPLALCAVFFMKGVSNQEYILKIVICMVGIVFSELISIIVYSLWAAPDGLKDQVSIAVIIGSFIGQLVVFLLALGLLAVLRKLSG